MSSSQVFTKLQEEVICPICLGIFQNPVTIGCGHNFCLKCLTGNVDPSVGLLKCPLCKHPVRKDALTTNWVLMNLVEMIQEMCPSEEQPGRGERKCQKHQEQLHYFCENDGNFLCIVCRESKEHKQHKVTVMEDAAQKYKELLNSQLEVLQQKQKAIMQVKTQGKQKIEDFMAQVEQEIERVTAEFNQQFQVLKEEETALMSRLHELAQEGENASNLYITSIDAQLNFLDRFIQSLKAKKQMTPSDLLWNIRYMLNRSQGFQFLSPTPLPLDLEKTLGEAKSRHNSVLDSMKKCRENIQPEKKKGRSKFFRGASEDSPKNFPGTVVENNSKSKKTSGPKPPSPGRPSEQASANQWPSVILSFSRHPSIRKPIPMELLLPQNRRSFPGIPQRLASFEESLKSTGATEKDGHTVAQTPVTFDATSAHPDLILSQDLKTVTLGAISSNNSEAPDEPARFNPFRCVVGSPGLSCGQQAWEAELRGPEGGACIVGVASEHAARRDFLSLEPAAGFWTLRFSARQCQALVEGGTRKDLQARPSRVGVSVDHERGEVAFYDAATAEHIYTFHASFPGQIFPFFRLLFPGTQITLRPWSR